MSGIKGILLGVSGELQVRGFIPAFPVETKSHCSCFLVVHLLAFFRLEDKPVVSNLLPDTCL